MLAYSDSGELVYPKKHDRAPESELENYLQYAATLVGSLPDPTLVDTETGMSADFDLLRWFDLSATSLER